MMLSNKVINEYFQTLYRGVPQEFYVLALILLCVGAFWIFATKRGNEGWRYATRLLLIEYILFIFCSTVFFRKVSKVRAFDLTPFWSYSKPELLVENVMNVVIFVPVGLLSGIAFGGITWKMVMLIGMCLSVGIEVLQFVFKRGFMEVDDVMHNTLGCVMGYGLFCLLSRLTTKKYGYTDD